MTKQRSNFDWLAPSRESEIMVTGRNTRLSLRQLDRRSLGFTPLWRLARVTKGHCFKWPLVQLVRVMIATVSDGILVAGRQDAETRRQ